VAHADSAIYVPFTGIDLLGFAVHRRYLPATLNAAANIGASAADAAQLCKLSILI
jgi:hypothetical protein